MSGIKDRLHYGQLISDVNEDGIVTVRVFTTQENFDALVPNWGLSISRNNSCWMRFYPLKGAYCICGYDMLGRPKVVSWTAWGQSSDGKQDLDTGGMRRVNNLAKADLELGIGNPNSNALKRIRKLKPGEWDIHSSGGADICGNADGLLRMASGRNFIAVNASQGLIKSDSPAFLMKARGSSLKFGEVRRRIPPPLGSLTRDTAVLTGLNTSPLLPSAREFKLTVAAELVGGVSTKMTEYVCGDVFLEPALPSPPLPELLVPNPTLVPGVTDPLHRVPTGLPLRERKTIYAPASTPVTPVPVLEVKTDVTGNVDIAQAPTAALAGVQSEVARHNHMAQTTATLGSYLPLRSVYLGSLNGTQGTVSRPGTAPGGEAYVLGTTWEIQRKVLHTTLVTSMTALALALGQAATAAGQLQPPAAGGQLATAMTAAAATATAMAASITAFEAAGPVAPAGTPPGPSYVSQKVFGDG